MTLAQDVPPDTDFGSRSLAGGAWLHVRRTARFKSVWVDVFLPQLMQPTATTRLALLGRLLERGTRQLPDLRALNRYTDWLYGAAMSVQTLGFGPFQVLHLHYDAVDGTYVPEDGGNLLESGLRLLGDVLTDPYLEDGALPVSRLQQEKESLRRYVDGLHNDRSLLAQRRCMELMCAGSPWALTAYGDPAEMADIQADELLRLLGSYSRTAPMDIYVCGDVEAEDVSDLCSEYLPRGDSRRVPPAVPGLPPPGISRHISEPGDVAQGRLVLGFRTPVLLSASAADYAALLLLNLLFGGDAHSRLYNRVREDLGLCYHIASYLEPMAGLVLVEAGVEPTDRQAVVEQVLGELADLAQKGPSMAEFERSQALARQRFDSAIDGRDSLVRFHYTRRLAGSNTGRDCLLRALGSVTPEAVRCVATDIRLDTVFFLAPADALRRD